MDPQLVGGMLHKRQAFHKNSVTCPRPASGPLRAAPALPLARLPALVQGVGQQHRGNGQEGGEVGSFVGIRNRSQGRSSMLLWYDPQLRSFEK